MLNEKQKEFVVERINKYNEEVNEQKKNAAARIFRIGIGAIGAVLMATKAQGWNMSDWVSVPILVYSISYTVRNAGHLICSVAMGAGLALRVRELHDQSQLSDLADQEETKDNLAEQKKLYEKIINSSKTALEQQQKMTAIIEKESKEALEKLNQSHVYV